MNVRAVTTNVLLGLAPIALLILLWQAMVSFGYAPVTLLPPPGQVFGRMVQQFLNATYRQDIEATLLRLFAGFAESKITLVAADALFPILLSTYYGASTVEQKLIWSAMAAGTSHREILFKVVLPAAAPSILTGCRIGLVISCIVVFLAEMITSTDGLGHVLVTAARTFQAVDMFVPLITISLLGLILNGALEGLRSYLLRGFPEV